RRPLARRVRLRGPLGARPAARRPAGRPPRARPVGPARPPRDRPGRRPRPARRYPARGPAAILMSFWLLSPGRWFDRWPAPDQNPTLPSPARGEGTISFPPPLRGRAGWGVSRPRRHRERATAKAGT